jgi:hypothetical protein
LDFLAEFAGEDFKGGSWDFAQGAAEEFLSDSSVLAGEIGEFLVRGGGEVGIAAFLVVEESSVDFGLGLAIPGDDCGFRDAELTGDAGKAPALDTETEEFGAGGGGMHTEVQSSKFKVQSRGKKSGEKVHGPQARDANIHVHFI